MSAAPPGPADSAPPEPGSGRLIATVGLAGLLSGIAIVGTYQATLPRITENQAAAMRAAVFEVVPQSASLAPLVDTGGGLVPAGGAAPRDGELFAAWTADGEFAGYAIAAEGPGFQDTIRLLFGFDAAGSRVVGMRVLESRETPGLGDKIFKDPAFVAEFRDLQLAPEAVLVPRGTDAGPNAVDGITGATISSKAVVRIVNAGAARWQDRLPAAGFPPPDGPAPEGD